MVTQDPVWRLDFEMLPPGMHDCMASLTRVSEKSVRPSFYYLRFVCLVYIWLFMLMLPLISLSRDAICMILLLVSILFFYFNCLVSELLFHCKPL